MEGFDEFIFLYNEFGVVVGIVVLEGWWGGKVVVFEWRWGVVWDDKLVWVLNVVRIKYECY